jgi:iron(III) transport system substrate-binding protein
MLKVRFRIEVGRGNRRSLIVFLMSVCPLLLALYVPGAFAASALEEGARREGKVVWYSTVTEANDLAKQFQIKYPFVRVEVFRMNTEQFLNRITSEVRAGTYGYDVVRATGIDMYPAIKMGLLQPYDSPERKAYGAGWKDEKGLWTSTDDRITVLGYNTRLVAESDVPKQWEDLLKPRWKGNIGIDPGDYDLYLGFENRWGAAKALAYFKKLAEQEIQFRKGHTLLSQLVVAGEMPMAFVYLHRAEAMKAQGAPIEWVSTMDPITSSIGIIGLGAKPQNPNAAKLLIDYVLSTEGQQVLQKLQRIPSRSDIKPLTAKLDRRSLRLTPLRPDQGENIKGHISHFRSLFGLQQ